MSKIIVKKKCHKTNFPVASRMFNVTFTQLKQFSLDIDNARKNLYTPKKELLIDNNIIVNLNDFSQIKEGRFTVKTEVVDFDCLYKDNKQEKLYVLLSAGITNNSKIPEFQRWSYEAFLDGNVLCVADPMYKIHKGLYVGWYYGTETVCYLDHLVRVIEEFAKQFKIKPQNIVFFGSSAGGYASIYLASKIKHSNCLAINPQIKMSLFPYYNDFVKITGLNPEEDFFNRNDISKTFLENNTSNFVLVESCRSHTDIDQISYICDKLKTNFEYGLSQIKKNVTILAYDTGINVNTHRFVETKTIMWALTNLVDEIKNKKDINKLKNEYMLICELWTEIANLNQQLDNEKNKK